MDFRMVYEGPLKSSGNTPQTVNKNQVRRVLHDQLADIWERHPVLLRMKTYKWRDYEVRRGHHPSYRRRSDRPVPDVGETEVDAIGRRHEKNGIRFVPLVTEALSLVCGLDILFLRRGTPGSVITQGGDIDGRLKTLLDALHVPKNNNEMKGAPDSTSPLFCLLEDDALVTDVSVTTDRLLTPLPQNSGHPESQAHR